MVAGGSRSNSSGSRAMLVGVGFDNSDGHVRVTRGDQFRLVGGSHETHEHMQEQAVKFTEKLSDRGRRLENITPQEFVDIAHDVGMNVMRERPAKE